MHTYYSLCFLSTWAIGIAFLNQYLLRIQVTIAITASALMGSFVLIILGWLGWFNIEQLARRTVSEIDFQHFLLNGILGFLLFSGALEVRLYELRQQKWEIAILSLLSTPLSTMLVGTLMWIAVQSAGITLPLIYFLLFGALISPTDPIAVLAIIKQLQAPKQLLVQVEGESLFNDGIGLVIFITLFMVAFGGHEATFGDICTVFLQEAVGGMLYGIIIGMVANCLIHIAHDSSLALFITLLIPTSGFALANILQVSGALAMVTSGIIIGNWTQQKFSLRNRYFFTRFWTLIEQFFNAVLFLLIGLTLLLVKIDRHLLWLVFMAIPICLCSRYLSVLLPFTLLRQFRSYNPYTTRVLTWGGLRGGLALAMALSIPVREVQVHTIFIDVRGLLLMMTYGVVLFSILVQGSTIEPLLKKAKFVQQSMK